MLCVAFQNLWRFFFAADETIYFGGKVEGFQATNLVIDGQLSRFDFSFSNIHHVIYWRPLFHVVLS